MSHMYGLPPKAPRFTGPWVVLCVVSQGDSLRHCYYSFFSDCYFYAPLVLTKVTTGHGSVNRPVVASLGSGPILSFFPSLLLSDVLLLWAQGHYSSHRGSLEWRFRWSPSTLSQTNDGGVWTSGSGLPQATAQRDADRFGWVHAVGRQKSLFREQDVVVEAENHERKGAYQRSQMEGRVPAEGRAPRLSGNSGVTTITVTSEGDVGVEGCRSDRQKFDSRAHSLFLHRQPVTPYIVPLFESVSSWAFSSCQRGRRDFYDERSGSSRRLWWCRPVGSSRESTDRNERRKWGLAEVYRCHGGQHHNEVLRPVK